MTIIQPHKEQHIGWTIALGGLIAGLGFSAIALVMLYNHSVDLTHAIADARLEMKRIETSNAEMTDRMFNLFTNRSLDELAAQRSLVKEKEPRYLDIGKPWALVSR